MMRIENARTLNGDRANQATIREIADQSGRPFAEVSALYRDVFEALSAQASVAHYLPVFVARKVRERYLGMAASSS